MSGPLSFRGVALDEPCATCGTSGVVASELWARWLRRFDHEELRLQAERPRLERSQIVDGAAAYAGPEPTEPEELPCPTCEGQRFTLTTAGEELRAFARRHL